MINGIPDLYFEDVCTDFPLLQNVRVQQYNTI